MRRFVFLDVETSGLDPEVHQIIEVGLVIETAEGVEEKTFSLPFDKSKADPKALEVNGWGVRKFPVLVAPDYAVGFLAEALRDAHIVGKNPSFDERFLRALFKSQDIEPTWHHRLVDIGSLVWGWYNAQPNTDGWAQPPDVNRVALAMGEDGYNHTALDDALWAYRVFCQVVPR